MKETEKCKHCNHYKTEYSSGGYGMPMRERKYCELEKYEKKTKKNEKKN